jgi:hypothetical protein
MLLALAVTSRLPVYCAQSKLWLLGDCLVKEKFDIDLDFFCG